MNTPTQKDIDEQRLREIETDINELIELISYRINKDQATITLDTKQRERQEHLNNREQVFHKQKNGNILHTTMHTKTHMELADALKHRIKLGKYKVNLEESLKELVNEQVEILQRQLKLAKY